MTTRVAFVGAGSVVFTRDLVADLLRMTDLGPLHLALHDVDAERLATAEAIARRVAAQLDIPVEVSTHPQRRPAFDGAAFVINAAQVGGIASTRVDFEVPARFGVRQTIADTLGPGGVFRALRTFPLLDGIAVDMRAVCPDAWLLNYTNPMSMNVRYLSAVAPDLHVLGMCHSVYWTVHDLCELLDVPYEDVSYLTAGVNHQAWLLRWERDGQDLYPLLDDRIAADEQLRRRVRVDMYRRLGYYPTETSEHSSEYVPWYLPHDEEIARLRIPVGDYLRISEENLQEYADTKSAIASGTPLELSDTTEYAPQVIHSMLTGTPRTIVTTIPNHGWITNLPAGSAVEVPTLVDELGARPLGVGAIPPQCAALNRAFLNVGELTVAAAVDGDPRRLRQALLADPNTAATLSAPRVWELADALVAGHGEMLPEPLRASLPWSGEG